MGRCGLAGRDGLLAQVWRIVYGRRWRRVLALARRMHGIDARALAGVAVLTDRQRQVLLVAIRRSDVRFAACAPATGVMVAAGAVLAATCLLGPPVVVALAVRPDLRPAELLVSAGLYLALFGLASAAYFHRLILSRWRRQLVALSWVGAGASFAATVVVATFALRDGGAGLRTPAVLGVLAGMLAAVVIVLVRRFVLALQVPVLGWWLRRCGTLPPSQLVAVRLAVLLMQFNDVQGQWRQRRARSVMLARASWAIVLVEQWIPQVMWWAGIRGSVLDPAVRRCRDAGVVLRALRWELMDAGTSAAFDQLQRRLASAAAAVAEGDWSELTSNDPPSRVSRLLTFARRLVTPAALVAAAAALPYLPGVGPAGAATTTVQVGLLVAALLRLTSVEGTAQDRILSAVHDTYQAKP